MRWRRPLAFLGVATLSGALRALFYRYGWQVESIIGEPDAFFAPISVAITTAAFFFIVRTARPYLADFLTLVLAQLTLVVIAVSIGLALGAYDALGFIFNSPILLLSFLLWRMGHWTASIRNRLDLLRPFSAFILALGSYVYFDQPLTAAYRLIVFTPGGAPPIANAIRIAVIPDEERTGRRIGVLVDTFAYCDRGSHELYLAPAGFETDFASIPRLAQIAINPFGRHAEAAVIHDWLYAVGEPGRREHADNVFRDMMREAHVNVIKRNAMYAAVRAGGGDAYGNPSEWRFRNPYTLEAVRPSPPRRTRFAESTCDG